ncbi:GNAT family N-acetyltransferase [Alicyclobacillus curvatus]|nr:GNAT family N-acetyltransferase [Alicyclobacillus curvatus]
MLISKFVGKRVTLRPLQAEDAGALYEAGRAPDIWTYMTSKIQTRADMDKFVMTALKNYESATEIPFVVIDNESGALLGSTRYLDISMANRGLEIGFTWLSPQVWRTRVNTECKYLLMKHAFETLSFIRVQWKTDSRNIRSQQAIERLGAVREGVLRKHRILSDGYVRDSVYYSVIAEEWPAVKARLEAFLQND